MSKTVLHLRGDHLKTFALTDAFLGQGNRLTVHVDQGDGSTEIWDFHRTPDGRTQSACTVNSATFGCGCP